MRVLVDPGSHHLLNAGDVAMLQVALGRLCERASQTRIQVLTSAPELLAHHCPGAEALPAEGRYAALARRQPPGEQPPASRAHAPRAGGRVLARARLRLAARARGGAERAFLEALLDADLLLYSGRGCLTEAFAGETGAMLSQLALAARIGLPSALLGQGIGPLHDPALRAGARTALAHVGLLALREGRTGPALAAALGVARERVVVTGDDAIEPALAALPATPGEAIGLSVRAAPYAEIERADAAHAGEVARAVAERHGTTVAAIRISSHPGDDETSALAGAGLVRPAPGGAPGARPVAQDGATPAAAIAAAGRCRVVVAGAYHAALFALAQGVPAVGVARSPYYRDKLLGLDERFPGGCTVIALDRPGWDTRLAVELERQWAAAPALRGDLVAAAEAQVATSRAAHARAFALAGLEPG